jgi:hypothetical protein
VERLEDLLLHDRVFFDDQMVCANPYMPVAERKEHTMQTFFQQLSSYRRVFNVSADPSGLSKVSFSGKVDAENKVNPRFRDDLVQVCLMNAYAELEIMRGNFILPQHVINDVW